LQRFCVVGCDRLMSEEKRKDPEDGKPYTLAELRTYYKGRYSKQEIASYWDTLKPVKGKGKGKAAKAKGKAEAKPKEKQRRGAANPKRFINEEASIVTDAVDGLIWATPNLGRIDLTAGVSRCEGGLPVRLEEGCGCVDFRRGCRP